MRAQRPPAAERHVAYALCLLLTLGLAGLMTFQTLIPELLPLWGLSATEAGWLAGAGHLSYAIVAPFVVALTDRIDARRVVLVGLLLSAVAGFGFMWLAAGFWSAFLWRLMSGLGIAAAYMPGLKALADRVHGPEQGRLQSFYTASYSLGTALSLQAAGLATAWLGWRAAFALSGLLPALAILLLMAAVRPAAPQDYGAGLAIFDPRPVLRDRTGMGFILGYAGHCFELFGFRTWLVAFLTFAAIRQGAAIGAAGIATIATVVLLLGLPASILGNELASRVGRRSTLLWLMAGSGAVAAVAGLSALLPFWSMALLMALYNALMMTDSAALTVGLVGGTPPLRRGLTIGVQQLFGTAAAFVAPLVSGCALDLLGAQTIAGWWVAIALLGCGALAGAAAVSSWTRAAPTSVGAVS